MIFFAPLSWVFMLFLLLVVFFGFMLFPVPTIILGTIFVWGCVTMNKRLDEVASE